MISLLTTLLNNVILLLGNEKALVRGGEGDGTSANGQLQTAAGGGKPSKPLCGGPAGGGTITGCEGPLFGRKEEHMSDNERKQVEILEGLAEKMTAEARTLWLAYGMGLADGAQMAEFQQAAG